MAEPDALLRAVGIQKSYETPRGRLEVLRGVQLEIRKGEICYIVGRSGSGKSTLLHILGSLDRPTKGAVFFEGLDFTTLGERELAQYRNEKMGFVFQFYHLLPELNLVENVLLPARIARKKSQARWAHELLDLIGLGARAHHYPSEVSGGEQQRAAIARALVNHPKIVFCDEPTGNLDEETAEEVFRLLLELNRKQGQTLCIVTHEESLVRDQSSAFVLHEGVLKERSS